MLSPWQFSGPSTPGPGWWSSNPDGGRQTPMAVVKPRWRDPAPVRTALPRRHRLRSGRGPAAARRLDRRQRRVIFQHAVRLVGGGTTMKDQILGTTMPVLSISLDGGESVVAEVGEFSWMTDSIQMSTGMGGGVGGQGLMGALKRKIGGGTLLMSTYTAQGAPGVIAFASKVPGSILPIDVAPGRDYMVHRHGFLAGTPGIQI